MTYLGIARFEDGRLRMPDAFAKQPLLQSYEAIDGVGDTLLVASPLDRKRFDHIDALTGESINEHRELLAGFAQ